MNAKSLFKIEFIKLLKQTYFWLVAAFIIIFFSLITIKLSSLNLKLSFLFPNSNDIVTQKFFIFPNVWHTVAWIAGFFNHFLAFLIIIFVSNEFQDKTFRQLVDSGTHRKHLINTKLFIIFLLPLILFFLILIFSLTFGNIYSKSQDFNSVFDGSIYLFTYYLQAIGLMMLGLMLVIIFKKCGISIMMYINIFVIEFTFRFWLSTTTLKSIAYFLPFKCLSLLTPRPSVNICLKETTAMQFHIKDLTTPKSIFLVIGVSIIYAIVFYIISRKVIQQKRL